MWPIYILQVAHISVFSMEPANLSVFRQFIRVCFPYWGQRDI